MQFNAAFVDEQKAERVLRGVLHKNASAYSSDLTNFNRLFLSKVNEDAYSSFGVLR